jgi:SAM-dependent methyltransferase
MTSRSPCPSGLDPSLLLRERDGIYAADLLIAAITEFDFFARMSDGMWTARQLQSKFEIAARPLDVMLTLFTAMGLLRQDGDGHRLNPQAAAFLSHESKWDMGPYFASLKLRPQIQQIVGVLTTDRPARWESADDNRDWANAMVDEAFARRFTAAMNGRGEWLGPRLAGAMTLDGARSLLDVGGGSGVYARVFQERYPDLNVAVLERPPVDAVARSYLDGSEAGRRVRVLPGDMFQAIPNGFDVHLFSNVLHDWGEPQVRALLERSRASLPQGGQIVIHDAFIDRNKQGPLAVARYSVLLMLLSDGKCYSIAEMEDLLTAAGFREIRHRDTTADRGVIVARAA